MIPATREESTMQSANSETETDEEIYPSVKKASSLFAGTK
jgi:hypothetical protein